MSVKSVLDVIRDARTNGVEIDPDELNELGLSADSADETVVNPVGNILSQELSGTAAGMVELFLSAPTTAKVEAKEGDNLMWFPIIRSGQWAVRPGMTGTKKKVPLRVVAGKSTNQRRQIGLQDLVDAFNDEAIQHVTVPSSHNNTVLENQGFIKGMKIVAGEVKNAKTKKMEKVSVLMGGYDITEPETKKKMLNGSIANRSAGILYDYVNTETGKSYPAVIEHVALTNKPWITGMISFGRKLAGSKDAETVGLSLSDDAPMDESEYALALADELFLSDDDLDFLAQESTDWSKEGSPNWLKSQVNALLEEARAKKIKAQRAAAGGSTVLYDDYPPHYRCAEAKPGTALIADGYTYSDNDANYWAAPITVKDGAVELGAFDTWKALKKAYIPDERPKPKGDKLPLDQTTTETDGAPAQPKSRIELAREDRRRRFTGKTNNDPREVVGNMAGDNENGGVHLSEEELRDLRARAARADQAEEKVTKLSETVARLSGSVQGSETTSYLNWLKSDQGLGLSEANGFGGFLVELEKVLLSDDGEPVVQSDHFATDDNKTGEISLSESFKRVFGALHKATEGKKRLGEALSQPADGAEPAGGGEAPKGGEGAPEGGTSADQTTTTGKPGAGEGGEDETKLSTEQQVKKIAESSPEIAALMGGIPKGSDS